ncbi:phage protein GemA/Gp16 family protein [Anaeromassilibacillus senegalensis]|uniref:phage protein GemA/Gp16 family protein n=1 Tax=Anaeromassilibacillus senegalensis TaxID=1673717 RepID=UPI0006812BA3|nr:phage protein GemA/Gp16 family protein [Anaeromassilibacillus senegalensis]
MNGKEANRLFGMAAKLGMNKDDLRNMSLGLTGEWHLSKLTNEQYCMVVNELDLRLNPSESERSPRKNQPQPTVDKYASRGMTVEQQKKAWQLMYKLKECDQHPRCATLGERVRGIIKKHLGIDADPRQPFRWLDCQQGIVLIDMTENYVKSAARKAGKTDSSSQRSDANG